MYPSAYDLKSFYHTEAGQVVRRVVREKIRTFWPNSAGLRVMGMGYAMPYLRPFTDTAEQTFAIMPSAQGAHAWPDDGGNVVTLAEGYALPLETNSVDRILMVHTLEFSGIHADIFEEVWRVLKSSGRVLIVAPNRMGLWARAEWSPFGQGLPFSVRQLEKTLRDHMFIHERTEKTLYTPPIENAFLLKTAPYFERFGRYVYPALAGLHFVEASKQLYAGTARRVLATAREKVSAPASLAKPEAV